MDQVFLVNEYDLDINFLYMVEVKGPGDIWPFVPPPFDEKIIFSPLNCPDALSQLINLIHPLQL